jgi:hypothetical protein
MPERVALLIDEKRFIGGRGLANHRETVFILDRMHDWEYNERTNTIRVFGTIDPDAPFDIVVAYEVTEDPAIWAKVHVLPGERYDTLDTCLNGWQTTSMLLTPELARKILVELTDYLKNEAISNARNKRKSVRSKV